MGACTSKLKEYELVTPVNDKGGAIHRKKRKKKWAGCPTDMHEDQHIPRDPAYGLPLPGAQRGHGRRGAGPAYPGGPFPNAPMPQGPIPRGYRGAPNPGGHFPNGPNPRGWHGVPIPPPPGHNPHAPGRGLQRQPSGGSILRATTLPQNAPANGNGWAGPAGSIGPGSSQGQHGRRKSAPASAAGASFYRGRSRRRSGRGSGGSGRSGGRGSGRSGRRSPSSSGSGAVESSSDEDSSSGGSSAPPRILPGQKEGVRGKRPQKDNRPVTMGPNTRMNNTELNIRRK